ncbi:MAG: VWA domain-containing protein, partial [Acetobacteraceae bacterium]|nr:VWA domain-containing protein [Acetobacteraceae bacterium]
MSSLPDKPGGGGRPPDKPGSGAKAAVNAFLDRLAAMPRVAPASGRRGRLVFAMDATASRQPSWDRACRLQGEMFQATRDLGGLAVQLAYYRGFKEFAATPFLTDADDLTRRMTGVQCLGGQTQIQRMLEHVLAETRAEKVNALVFVGDAMEEQPDPICHRAGELGLMGTPCFVFQEGDNPMATNVFRQIAKLSGGAWAPFDAGSADALRDLLRAVAVFAAGGRGALARLPGAAA